jgi:hypothetical protein
MPPAFMLLAIESDVDKRPPLRTLRFANKRHLRLVREPVTLAGIARDAGTNNVFPSCQATFIAWQHVIEIQLLALENPPTVLTGIIVAFKDVVPRKLYFLFRKPVKKEEYYHSRHPDFPRDGGDHLMLGFWRGDRKVEPTREIVRRKVVLLIGRDDLRVSLVEKRKGTTRRADIHRLPEAIEHQNLTVKYGVQRIASSGLTIFFGSNWREIIIRDFRCQRDEMMANSDRTKAGPLSRGEPGLAAELPR